MIVSVAAVEAIVASSIVLSSIRSSVSDLMPDEIVCLAAKSQQGGAEKCFDRAPWYAADPFLSAAVTTVLVTLLVWLVLRWERAKAPA